MRIIAGAWRARPLDAPAGGATRPTSDRAREGLFSMLASRIGTFDGLRVADLFAGTGALGLEALSRGAAHCTFIDNDGAALDILKRNISRLGAQDHAEVRAQAVEHAPPPAVPWDLVFLDPPYRSGLAAPALTRLSGAAWLASGAWISVESTEQQLEAPPGFETVADRRFGKARIHLFRAT